MFYASKLNRPALVLGTLVDECNLKVLIGYIVLHRVVHSAMYRAYPDTVQHADPCGSIKTSVTHTVFLATTNSMLLVPCCM